MAEVVVTEVKSWIQNHERVVLLFLTLSVIGWLGNKWIDASAAKSSVQATIATQQAVSAQKSAEQAAAQAAQTAAAYQTMVDALQKQNASLAQAVTQRDAVLGQQQAAVKTAPLPVVAQQWQSAIGGQGDIVSGTNGMTVSDDGARRTLTMLMELPVAQADFEDQKKITANVTAELAKANELNASNGTLITALNTEITKNNEQCKADLIAVKAEGRKNSVKWFKRGFVAGLVSGLLLGHAAGI